MDILFLLFFKELNIFHLLQPHEESWRASVALLPHTHTFPFSFQGCRGPFNLIGFVYAFIWPSALNAYPQDPGQALDLF